MNSSEQTILCLRQLTTDALLCAALLAAMSLVLFMKIAQQLVGTFKKAVNFA
tara:strand:+ start:1081 stop:1236 length:156 start_codon:yes stop_codon:yes gene_type:complete